MITIQNLTCLSTIEHRCRGLVLVASLGISIMASRQRGQYGAGIRECHGEEVARLAHQETVMSVAFSPDGRLLAVASLKGALISAWRSRKSLTTSARISPSTSPRRSGNSTCQTNHTVRPVRTSLDPRQPGRSRPGVHLRQSARRVFPFTARSRDSCCEIPFPPPNAPKS